MLLTNIKCPKCDVEILPEKEMISKSQYKRVKLIVLEKHFEMSPQCKHMIDLSLPLSSKE